jgi:hypothetical protein
MLRISIASWIIMALALLLIPAGNGASAATECGKRAGILEILPGLELPIIIAAPARRRLRLSEGRSCTESCMGQCRQAQSSCGSGKSCRADFQICARRCVVSCGSR